jgi:hypothetical protein
VPLKLRYVRTGLAVGPDRAWISARLTRASAAFGTSVRDQHRRVTLRVQDPGAKDRLSA